MKEWFTCFQMWDDAILVNTLQANEQQEMQETTTEEYENAENDAGPFHTEAFQAFETASKRFEKQT